MFLESARLNAGCMYIHTSDENWMGRDASWVIDWSSPRLDFNELPLQLCRGLTLTFEFTFAFIFLERFGLGLDRFSKVFRAANS